MRDVGKRTEIQDPFMDEISEMRYRMKLQKEKIKRAVIKEFNNIVIKGQSQ